MLRHATLVAAPSIVTHFAEAGTVNVTVCPVKMIRCSGSANSNQHLVLARGQPDYDDCIAVAKVPPMPRQVVDGNMQMADPRRYAESAGPEHR
jgi:hypothetical protein